MEEGQPFSIESKNITDKGNLRWVRIAYSSSEYISDLTQTVMDTLQADYEIDTDSGFELAFTFGLKGKGLAR